MLCFVIIKSIRLNPRFLQTCEALHIVLFAYAANNPVHYIDPTGMWSDKMEAAIDNHISEAYEAGTNDCDAWTQKVEKEAHPDSNLSEKWGDASKTNASGHRENLKDSLSDNMSLGTNIVIQTQKSKSTPNHVLIACLNEDGTVDVAECTKYPCDKSLKDTMPGGYSEKFSYASEDEFKNDGWGKLEFYSLGDADDYVQKSQNQTSENTPQKTPQEKMLDMYYKHH